MLRKLMVRQSRTVELTLYGMIVVASAAMLGVYVYDVGWAPEAEGMYAEFGARVSRGHWPHLHFEDSSLGGLSFLNAVLFAVGGTSILTLRVFLLSVFTIGTVAMVVLLSRATKVVTASMVAMVCLLWGPPVFLVPGPKWYVVVLGMMSCLAIFRHSEDGRLKWLVVTGIFSGIGILIHPPSALMLVIAVTVSILLLPAGDRKVEAEEGAVTEEDVSEPGAGTEERDASKPVPQVLAAKYIVLTLALVCAGLVVWQQESFGSLLYYIIGPAAVAAMLLYMEMKQPSDLGGYQVRRANLGRYCFTSIAMVLPFLLALA
ncbi:MAG: glycosyltransferase family 39 protein, partial [Gammaproteobacteria bacterium]|nr:glycosyltransferase family 39 protein [Gammaproteobacteria bacterium]